MAAAYEGLCARLTDPTTWVSLDLSHIAFDAAALDRILQAVPPGRRLQIGAEEAATADRVHALGVAAARRGLPVELTLQANLRRSVADADRLAAEGISIRLVKGAYVERPADAHPWGPATDNAYIALAHRLAADGIDVALATHDARLRAELLRDLPAARCELLLRRPPPRRHRARRRRPPGPHLRPVRPRLVPLPHAPPGRVTGRMTG